MKITKYLHSCLLVEDDGKVILIDPGNFTAQENVLNISSLKQLDYLIYTHAHQDHFFLPFAQEIVTKFPQVKIIATQEVVDQLQKENILATTHGDNVVKVENVPHEAIWGGHPGENIMVTIFGKLAHPGDSHTFTTPAPIVALPIAAPWGSTTAAIQLAEKLNPKVIIPIHDYMLKDTARQMMYQWAGQYLKSKGIDFKAVETGEVVEV